MVVFIKEIYVYTDPYYQLISNEKVLRTNVYSSYEKN